MDDCDVCDAIFLDQVRELGKLPENIGIVVWTVLVFSRDCLAL